MIRYLAVALLVLAARAYAFSGEVVGVPDGDTLVILSDQERVRVRIHSIDAPERGQAYGLRSRLSLTRLCYGKHADVEPVAGGRSGITFGRVTCDGIDAARHQVSRGSAWTDPKYAEPDSPLYDLQDAAMAERRGLWAAGKRVPPWNWRADKPSQ